MTITEQRLSPAPRTPPLNRLGALLFVCLGLCAGPAAASEVQSISWQQDALQVRTSGPAAYRTLSLEGGQRLRLVFPGATLGPKVAELEGRGQVKGVYPYMADNGTAVNVDILMTRPGELKVRRQSYGYLVAAVAGAAAAAPAAAPAPAGNTLEGVLYNALPGGEVQITLQMAHTPEEPRGFTISNPAQVALDFFDTRIGMPQPTVKINEGPVQSLTAVEAQGRTRVVLSLVRSVPYTTSIADKSLVITVQNPTPVAAGVAAPQVTRFTGRRKAVGLYSIKNVDFRRGPQGDGKVIVTLSEPQIGINLTEQGSQVILDFLGTQLPTELQRRLDVTDFATPVQTIDTMQVGDHVHMVITPLPNSEHIAYQAGNTFTVDFRPISKEAAEAKAKTGEAGYTGKKLSLNFQNIDVRSALQVLADFTGLNFVIDDSVKGSLTLRLKDVPWDQALAIILQAKNLAMQREGNVVLIEPAAQMAAREKANLEAQKTQQSLEPLVTELIPINYAKAEDIAALLKSFKPTAAAAPSQYTGSFGTAAPTPPASPAGGNEAEGNSMLSPRGQVSVDKRTNSLLIQDTPDKIAQIRKLIAKLDRPVRQVLIETRLVEASESFSRNLGVAFGTSTLSGAAGSLQATAGATLANGVGPAVGGLNVNLPATPPGTSPPATLALTLTKIGSTSLLNLELSALEAEGQGKIISTPRVVTGNQQKAVIEQGQERVFTTATQNTVGIVTKKANLALDVTPQITPDNRINLAVDITDDNFADPTLGLLNTKHIKTQVLLNNGETLVIGGIFQLNRNSTTTQVPFFGNIPLLGWLFKNKAFTDNKTELLIFLTPKILSDNLSVQ